MPAAVESLDGADAGAAADRHALQRILELDVDMFIERERHGQKDSHAAARDAFQASVEARAERIAVANDGGVGLAVVAIEGSVI